MTEAEMAAYQIGGQDAVSAMMRAQAQALRDEQQDQPASGGSEED